MFDANITKHVIINAEYEYKKSEPIRKSFLNKLIKVFTTPFLIGGEAP